MSITIIRFTILYGIYVKLHQLRFWGHLRSPRLHLNQLSSNMVSLSVPLYLMRCVRLVLQYLTSILHVLKIPTICPIYAFVDLYELVYRNVIIVSHL